MKKTLEMIKKILIILLVVFSIGMVIFTLISVNTFDRNDRSIFGYKAYIVRSDSMSKTDFEAGDLAIVKEVNPKTLKEGDIISFISTENESYGETITHKIRKVITNKNGELSFVTYGTTTNKDDQNAVTYDFVLGKYVGHIPKIGKFFMYLKTATGYFLCIFLPFALLTIYQTIKSFMLFKKYKAEQLKEIEDKLEAERKKLKEEQERLEEDRKKTLEMIEELKKMKTGELKKRKVVKSSSNKKKEMFKKEKEVKDSEKKKKEMPKKEKVVKVSEKKKKEAPKKEKEVKVSEKKKKEAPKKEKEVKVSENKKKVSAKKKNSAVAKKVSSKKN